MFFVFVFESLALYLCQGWNPSSSDPNAGQGHYGSCCTELDIWEANMNATQLTPHVCRDPAATQYRCEGDSCGDNDKNERYEGLCDKGTCCK